MKTKNATEIIGTCSICGGAVVVPAGGPTSAEPECSSCGAVKSRSFGPVIDMGRPDWGRPRRRMRPPGPGLGTDPLMPPIVWTCGVAL